MNTKQTTHKMFTNLNTSDNGRVLTFDIHNLDTSLVNGLRRTILNDIVNVGFGYEPENTITINENTTSLHDEFIAHRISLIPVMIEKWMETPATTDLTEYVFNLKVEKETQKKKNGYVTTDDFVVKHVVDGKEKILDTKKCFPRDFTDTPILITRFPYRESVEQKLDIECRLTKGTHGKHACFSPTAICVAYEKEVENNKYVHSFMIESIGVWPPCRLVYQGFTNLLHKCRHITNVVSNGGGSKYDGNYMAVDYILPGESHTMGNMIQEWIYNAEFGTNTQGKQLTHVSYHEPHPLENTIIIRLVLKQDSSDVITDFPTYKTKTTAIFCDYLEKLHAHIEMCFKKWTDIKHPTAVTLMK